MIARLLRTFAALASLVVILSWGLFAVDEARSASGETQAQIEGNRAAVSADPSPEQERAREAAHSSAREHVDDVDDVLLSPFASVADGAGSRWVRRTVPAALALLVYGVGVSFLARYAGQR